MTSDNTDQYTGLDKILDQVTDPLVVTGDPKSTDMHDIPVQEGEPGDRPGSGRSTNHRRAWSNVRTNTR